MHRIIFASFCTFSALAQETTFAVPLMGHVFDAQMQAIRPILGTPGAARVSAAIALDSPLSRAIVTGSRALATVQDHGLVAIGIGAETSKVSIADSFPSFDLAALSANGTHAVAFQKDCGCIQILSGLPSEPRVASSTQVAVDGEIQAVAISDEGSLAAIAVWPLVDEGEAPRGSIFLLRDGEWQRVAESRSPSLAFGPNAEKLAWVDLALSGVRTMDLVSGEVAAVAPDGEFWVEPWAVGFAGTRLVVGTREGVVTLVDLSTGERQTVECACRPEVIEPLTAKGMYRLTSLSRGAIWVLSETEQGVRTFFVPVDSEERP